MSNQSWVAREVDLLLNGHEADESREDAYVIAKAAGQVNDDCNGSDDELFSEGLY